jgi:hypothetical protein
MSQFERFVLCLVSAGSFAPEFESVIPAVAGPPTLSAATRLFATSPEEGVALKVSWERNLRRLRLVFDGERDGVLTLRQTVADFLAGCLTAPKRCDLFGPDDPLPEAVTSATEPDALGSILAARPAGLILAVTGLRGSGRKHLIKRFVRTGDRPVLFIPHESLEKPAEARRGVIEILSFLALTNGRPCVCDLPDAEDQTALAVLADEIFPESFFVTGTAPVAPKPPIGYKFESVEIPPPAAEDRRRFWETCGRRYPMPDDLGGYAERFRFTPGQIEDACASSVIEALKRGSDKIAHADLIRACRRQLSHGLAGSAVLVDSEFSWDDLVLPKKQIFLLRHIVDRIKYRTAVYGEPKPGGAYGDGVRALFTGAPGTGKTMAAQIIAAELDMELYKVDLSSLVSKYIGDTEKNLEGVFREAAKSGGVLFFDEADAIFGKRGEQKDSHDRYANMQTSFLLQRFEAYDGVVFLATNLQANMDPAYMRRVHVSVDFEKPNAELRKRIWERLFEGRFAVSKEVKTESLAQTFEMTGAEIKNSVMTAAFLAAATGAPIGNDQLIPAIIMEHAKNGHHLMSDRLGEYAYYKNKLDWETRQ